MEIPRELESYVTDYDKHDVNVAYSLVELLGVNGYLDKQLDRIDCTKPLQNGLRLMQTIGLPYAHEITMFLFVLDHTFDEILKEEYVNKLLAVHHKNLEYEKENKPIVYKKVKKAKEKVVKEKVPKESKKVAKAIAAANKIGKLKIMFKPK